MKKKFSLLLAFALGTLSVVTKAEGQTSTNLPDDMKWIKSTATRDGDKMLYVGFSYDEPSETQAVVAAEQDALTQMIKHYFGVKLKYSLQSEESLTNVNFILEKSETSESINIQGLARQNTKIVETKKGRFAAWVQISAPMASLRSEKDRLTQERREAEAEARRRRLADVETKKQHQEKSKSNMVPLIYIGMAKKSFATYYPAPMNVMHFGNREIYTYNNSWNFCEKTLYTCSVTFQDGKIHSWDYFSYKFIDNARSE